MTLEMTEKYFSLRGTIKCVFLASYLYLWVPLRNVTRAFLGSNRAVILSYHSVSDEPRNDDTIPIIQFKQQLQYLKTHCDVVDMPSFLASHGARRKKPCVVITFDDGYADNHQAAQILRSENLPATFFISTQIVGSTQPFPHDQKYFPSHPRSLDWEQVKQMSDWGFHIASHTANHVNLANVELETAVNEIRSSCKDLQEHLGDSESLTWLAYPFGKPDDINPEVNRHLEDIKIKYVFSGFGGTNKPCFDIQNIRRQPINNKFSMLAFRCAVAGHMNVYQKKLLKAVKRSEVRGPKKNNQPVAVLLGMGVTGLACARALSSTGIQVYGVSFSVEEIGRSSRACHVIDFYNSDTHAESLTDWILDFSKKFEKPPVIIPTNDLLALAVARAKDLLTPDCRVWNNSFAQLNRIISKNYLYEAAAEAGLPIPPTLISPTLDEVGKWAEKATGPYIIKPYYVGSPENRIEGKNITCRKKEELLRYIEDQKGGDGLIIQQMLNGGDGWILDCYGLVDRNANVKAKADHRRILQYPPDTGITCVGEIPAKINPETRQKMFSLTEKLLKKMNYHGIFGVEWLLGRSSGNLYLLDFNARPFYTIGHLSDCGLNLPLIAYNDLNNPKLTTPQVAPELQYHQWIDFWPSMGNFARRIKQRELKAAWATFCQMIHVKKSYAIWHCSDPGPAVRKTAHMFLLMGRKLVNGS